MPDSSEIDSALVALLQGDSTLATLMPDGVFIDEAAADARRFVIVSLAASTDIPFLAGAASRIVCIS